MKQSDLFTKTRKEPPKDEEAISSQLLVRAGFIDKLMAGVYTFLPLGFLVLKKIEKIIREEMLAIDGQEILMPVLHPKSLWQTTGRWDSYDSLFKFTSFYSKIEYALGPTHEEIVTPIAKKFIFSYKDLPRYVFQIQTKFRDEKRAKSGLLRDREFIMKDLYSFHKDEKDLDNYYEKVKKTYFKIFKRAGIGKLTYLTFASGGTFSKYSHEFQAVTEAGEDNIYLCEKCKIAINSEIINSQKNCPQCQGKKFKKAKAIEVGNIFKLKTRFSKSFGLSYKDKKGSEKEVIMGCYGIGLSRLLGAVAEMNRDERGIIWPKELAPFKIHLLLIGNSLKLKKVGEQLYNKLSGIFNSDDVLFDDRTDVSAGEKFKDADLIGLPYRLVLSEKTLKNQKVEIKKRDSQKIQLVQLREILELLRNTK